MAKLFLFPLVAQTLPFPACGSNPPPSPLSQGGLLAAPFFKGRQWFLSSFFRRRGPAERGRMLNPSTPLFSGETNSLFQRETVLFFPTCGWNPPYCFQSPPKSPSLKKEGEIHVEPLLFSTERSPDKSGKEGVGDDLEKEEGIGMI